MQYPWNIIGHEIQLLALEKELEKNQLTHAYFFHGPKDVGKFTVALLFAKILLCAQNLCHKCQTCLAIDHKIHPDFVVLQDEGESIKIETVRDLIQKTNLTPQGERRIVVIENIERMPIEAQNAFLKTLEEPSGETIFLLTSSNPKKVLSTILSRVRGYEFGSVTDDILREHLMNRFKGQSNPEDAVTFAQGRAGLGIRLLENPMLLVHYRDLFYKIEGFLQKNDLLAKFAFVEEIEKDPQELELFYELLAQLLQKKAREPQNLKQTHDLFEKFLETRYLTERNVNKKLALENLLLETEPS